MIQAGGRPATAQPMLLGITARATTAARAAVAGEDDLDREIEYAFDIDEPMLGRPPAGDVE